MSHKSGSMGRRRSLGIAVGCNAVPNACSWSSAGVLAFAANRSIGIYETLKDFGTEATLIGHKKKVTCVKWLNESSVVSGSEDCTLRVWRLEDGCWKCGQILDHHTKTISALSICEDVLVSAAMDGTFIIYRVFPEHVTMLRKKVFSPLLPLAIAMARLPGTDQYILAVGGTGPQITLYGTCDSLDEEPFELQIKTRLEGHDDWIRSFDFCKHKGDLLLASASQDRYIRLWRIDKRVEIKQKDGLDFELALLENKAHDFHVPDSRCSLWKVSFEALLVSHEDWVYSVHFGADETGTPKLLSASADSSVIIWKADPESQIWLVQAQLGTISTKGASTATGSTGGFWGAIFGPELDGLDPRVCAWNRTGSIRIWRADSEEKWTNIGGIGGHTKQVRSLSWTPRGEYFLTTSLDQTTRLWTRSKDDAWKEFARPQIHGYDIQSIHVVSPSLFLSGAEEKIVRIFRATTSVISLLKRVAGIAFADESAEGFQTAEAANVPALGLSNKALSSNDQGTHLGRADLEDEGGESDKTPLSRLMLDTLSTAPIEDHLQRHTLFPEIEKLYGHGYEIQALTVSHDMQIIVSGCRATSPDHATLRLYDMSTYKEIGQLAGHNLTVTKARFSPDDQYLLSVSRDRSWCLYGKSDTGYHLSHKLAKAHKRIIWDCAWISSLSFVTVSRDATCSVWSITGAETRQIKSIELGAAATAVALIQIVKNATCLLAIGGEDGSVQIHSCSYSDSSFESSLLDAYGDCDGAITGMEFQPPNEAATRHDNVVLAYCSEDCSVRVMEIAIA